MNYLDSELLTALDVAVECNNEQAIALLQAIGAMQGELVKKPCFGAKLRRLNTFYDTSKIKAKLAMQRQKALISQRKRVNGNVRPNISVDSGYHAEGVNSNGDSSDGVHTGNANGYDSHLSPATARASGTGDPEGGVFVEDSMRERLFSNQSLEGMTLKDMEDGNTLSTLYERLQQCINITLDITSKAVILIYVTYNISYYVDSFSANTDEAIAVTMQQKELLRYKKTEHERKPYSFNVHEGSRILFLDGGGMRGLIQIEILEQLEKKTGRKITELFDWIVGTSTGGIVALSLVYGKRLSSHLMLSFILLSAAKKSLAELRQLYFMMKEKVFGSDRFGFAYNTDNLEQLLKDEFGTTITMADEEFPK